MRILYSVQATGNGHISRARDVLPLLQKHGTVDVFLSGSNAHLDPGFSVKYKSKGLSLYYNNKGGLDYFSVIRNSSPLRLFKEARNLPVEGYDAVINDYECITSLACFLKKKKSIQFGHQASYVSDKVPRPKQKNVLGEFILHKYASADLYVGLHFRPYDKNIFTPILKDKIISAEPKNLGHITVYLGQYSKAVQIEFFSHFPEYRFEIFTGEVKKLEETGNIRLIPIDSESFANSMIYCHGVITGAGFETPAEALYLGKKLMVVPIHDQYEQLCNAEALREWNVPIMNSLYQISPEHLHLWYTSTGHKAFQLLYSNSDIVDFALSSALSLR